MRPFADRSPFIIGLVGMLLCVVIAGATLNYDKLPFVTTDKQYSAFFAEAGGLKVGAPVEVAGYRIGSVKSISLDGARVLVKFAIDKDVHLGSRSEANIRTKTLLGAKLLQITTLGDGELTAPIPIERTKAPYQLPDALGDLTRTISGIDTGTMTNALATLSETFRDTPPELKEAVDGVARFAQTLDARDAQLRSLLANASKATHVLSERTDQLVGLVGSTNALLIELRSQSVAVDNISANLSAFARQLKAFINENQTSLRPALDKLNGVLTLVDNRKDRIQQAVKYLNQYALSLGEVVGSGPFFKAYIVNLLPGQFIQPFIDAAFSDLGLDPNVLLPSHRTDPQTGQPATPPLPVPYPRTGQGGAPRLTLPDAITGNPGDPRYPYREPLPAPAPGGPPPGPPAPAAPGPGSTPEPTPSPVYHPAPNEVPPPGAPPVPGPTGGGQ
ncbi:MCE family protein [Mycobacterium vicinigordonae]|uniref:MCE family protein n=1 Tax=Mycobacterium vicinigordonae TaxID=1719132 RepID=A0A7D6I112_9MYCO|nr:MCE family protein [Mycobacterium vicinigordonae]QLL07554.1 MCE family protein [Mycobacterium vicinigordonae]